MRRYTLNIGSNEFVIDVQETCAYVEILGGKGALVLAGLAATPVKGRLYKAKLV